MPMVNLQMRRNGETAGRASLRALDVLRATQSLARPVKPPHEDPWLRVTSGVDSGETSCWLLQAGPSWQQRDSEAPSMEDTPP